jgi:hypothetical protein
MGRIKDRARRRAALGDRKSAAAQARMKNIASLAADERVPKKRRKGGGGQHLHLVPPSDPDAGSAQRTCSARTMRTGRFIARLCVLPPFIHYISTDEQ